MLSETKKKSYKLNPTHTCVLNLNLPDNLGRVKDRVYPVRSSVSKLSVFETGEPSKALFFAAMLSSPPPAIETERPWKLLDS